jgi:small-conductance mechanosensitive channel
MHGGGGALQVFGVSLIGANAENGRKLLITVGLVLVVWLAGRALRAVLGGIGKATASPRFRFWSRQVSTILLAAILVIGVLSIWFDDPSRLGAVAGLFAAGIAFALQRVITAVAGYVVILRGKTFNVGDRIVMGGVRGDVIELSFMQTKIMEMGESPSAQKGDGPPTWVHSRQFTGRIVTVTNDKIFDEPVYNYTQSFPYIWDEIRVPIRYADDRSAAERILIEAARRHAITPGQLGPDALAELENRFGLKALEIEPRVFWRITDNWLELALRFLAHDHGTRSVKDAMSREILAGLDALAISIASATSEVTLTPLDVTMHRGQPAAPRRG